MRHHVFENRAFGPSNRRYAEVQLGGGWHVVLVEEAHASNYGRNKWSLRVYNENGKEQLCRRGVDEAQVERTINGIAIPD